MSEELNTKRENSYEELIDLENKELDSILDKKRNILSDLRKKKEDKVRNIMQIQGLIREATE